VPDLAAAKAALKPPGENNLLAVYYRGQIRFAVITVPPSGR
jgi:hypothetical protein